MRTLEDFDQVKAPEIRGFLLTLAQKFKMKAIHLVLFSLLAISATAQTDTLWIGTPQQDTLNGGLIPCYQYECRQQVSHEWLIVNPYNGAVDIGAYPETTYEVLVISESFVVLDTCLVIYPFAGGLFQLNFSWNSHTRIVVNGPADSQIFIDSKIDPNNQWGPFPAPVVDLDTLCGTATGVDESATVRAYDYYDAFTLQLVTELRPNTAYLKRERRVIE